MPSASDPSSFRFARRPPPLRGGAGEKSTRTPRKINRDGGIKLKAEPREFYYVPTSELGLSHRIVNN